MQEHSLAAYIVPGTDPHASEYMAAHWMETTWLSGFKGEAGTVVVTMHEAKLFTDSRYYLQAGIELQGTGIDLMRASDIETRAYIAEGFSDEVDALYNRLNNCPVPSTPVYGRTPIFTCGGTGCGCGMAA